MTVGFNAPVRYLDVLGVHAAGDVIELGLTDEVGPGVLQRLTGPELHLRPDADAALRRLRTVREMWREHPGRDGIILRLASDE